jgi:hypothetical protein
MTAILQHIYYALASGTQAYNYVGGNLFMGRGESNPMHDKYILMEVVSQLPTGRSKLLVTQPRQQMPTPLPITCDSIWTIPEQVGMLSILFKIVHGNLVCLIRNRITHSIFNPMRLVCMQSKLILHLE